MLNFDEFVERLFALLEVQFVQAPNPYDGLYDDIGLDSIQVFQVIVISEALADATPLDDLPELLTLLDAYSYYEHLCGAS